LGLIEESESTSEYTNAVDIWSLGCITYGLLTSKAPFSDNRELAKFCRGRLAFLVQNLEENKVTTDAIVFLKQLLVAEPPERKSAQESLVSLWLTGSSARRVDDKPSDKNRSNSQSMLSSTISLSKKQPDPMNIKTTRTGEKSSIIPTPFSMPW
jgi:serine/threonine protein kinase